MLAECMILRALNAKRWGHILTVTAILRHRKNAALANRKSSKANNHSAAILESLRTPKLYASCTPALKLLTSHNRPSWTHPLQSHLNWIRLNQLKISRAGSWLSIQTSATEMLAVSPALRLTKQYLLLRASQRLRLPLISGGKVTTRFIQSLWISKPNGQINLPVLLPTGICLFTEKALKLKKEEELSFNWTMLESMAQTEALTTMWRLRKKLLLW